MVGSVRRPRGARPKSLSRSAHRDALVPRDPRLSVPMWCTYTNTFPLLSPSVGSTRARRPGFSRRGPAFPTYRPSTARTGDLYRPTVAPVLTASASAVPMPRTGRPLLLSTIPRSRTAPESREIASARPTVQRVGDPVRPAFPLHLEPPAGEDPRTRCACPASVSSGKPTSCPPTFVRRSRPAPQNRSCTPWAARGNARVCPLAHCGWDDTRSAGPVGAYGSSSPAPAPSTESPRA